MKRTKAMTKAIAIIRQHGFTVESDGEPPNILWRIIKGDSCVLDTTTTERLLAFAEKVKQAGTPQTKTIPQLLADSARLIEASKRLSHHPRSQGKE